MTDIAAPILAVAAVVREGDKVLLIRRGTEPEAGRWSVPGGRVEAGETLEDAVQREVFEEAGIGVDVGPLLGYVEHVSGGEHFVILDFVASPGLGCGGLQPSAGDDAAEAGWFRACEVNRLGLVAGLADFLACHHIL
ncbi:MAG: NUDIX hydrolase [Acidimicrobiales bacterium]